MPRFRQILKKILFPKWWIVLLSVPIAVAGLVYAFSVSHPLEWLTYLIYPFSFCSLIWICARVFCAAGHWRRDINALIDRIPVARKYLSDVSFNMNVTLYRSLGLNVLYAIAKFVFSLYYRSVWFGTLSVYYFLLAIIRFSLLRHSARSAFGADKRSEWRRYRLCGVLLLMMNLSFSGMVILVVTNNEGFSYAGYLIYIMALYAFYSITTAIINVVKYRKYNSPVMSAAKALHLVAALVSMLALETAMLTQFGSNDTAQFRKMMTSCTGGVICAFISGLSIYMIHRATKQIRKLEETT